jgi:hypothetical protein
MAAMLPVLFSEVARTLGRVEVTSTVPDLAPAAIRRALAGLPHADGYALKVIPLRFRGDKPHLSAWTDFEAKTITVQIPEPFLPFGEVVPYGATRRPGGTKLRFIWLTEGVTFRTPREVLRFLYLHEWMHWYLKERLGRKSQAETTCDRFALRNYRRRTVDESDAKDALRRQPAE